jgi:hypothetical protein
MAIKAPAHAMWFIMMHHAHLANITMATNAADSPVHVSRMIKINIVGSAMNSDPLDWLPII